MSLVSNTPFLGIVLLSKASKVSKVTTIRHKDRYMDYFKERFLAPQGDVV